jgi:uncharacterized membrane protein
VAGFNDPHTAFLARATLARLQKELLLSGRDLSVITRGDNRKVDIAMAMTSDNEMETGQMFWETLVALIFTPEPSADSDSDAVSAKWAAIGIDPAYRTRVDKQVRPDTAALLVLVRCRITRDKVLGVLQGFGGSILQVPFTGTKQIVDKAG